MPITEVHRLQNARHRQETAVGHRRRPSRKSPCRPSRRDEAFGASLVVQSDPVKIHDVRIDDLEVIDETDGMAVGFDPSEDGAVLAIVMMQSAPATAIRNRLVVGPGRDGA